VNSGTVDLLDNFYEIHSLSSEMSRVSPAEAKGIFSLKISMPLEQICSMAKLSAGKK